MSDKPLKVIAGSPDNPLRIAGFEIPCYVLENETRVLSQGGFLQALGRSRTPRAGTGAGVDKLPSFLAPRNLKPFIVNESLMSTNPLVFRAPGCGDIAYGYRAETLPLVCEVYLAAREEGVLYASQVHIAERAELLMRGFARIGIIALVDEATGYDKIRSKNALIKILEEFIAKELQPYTRTFPYSFYEEICKLRGWPGYYAVKRPHKIAEYTDDFVYSRIAPGVLDEVRKLNPVDPETGHRKAYHHQWFTDDIGHPKLRAHIEAVTALMRASANMTKFKSLLHRAYPNKYDNFMLAFMEDEE